MSVKPYGISLPLSAAAQAPSTHVLAPLLLAPRRRCIGIWSTVLVPTECLRTVLCPTGIYLAKPLVAAPIADLFPLCTRPTTPLTRNCATHTYFQHVDASLAQRRSQEVRACISPESRLISRIRPSSLYVVLLVFAMKRDRIVARLYQKNYYYYYYYYY